LTSKILEKYVPAIEIMVSIIITMRNFSICFIPGLHICCRLTSKIIDSGAALTEFSGLKPTLQFLVSHEAILGLVILLQGNGGKARRKIKYQKLKCKNDGCVDALMRVCVNEGRILDAPAFAEAMADKRYWIQGNWGARPIKMIPP
jgi:hypothetical protein